MKIIPFIETTESCEPRGTWLDVFCSDDSCLLEEERITLKDFCENSEEKQDRWLETFCPDDNCDIFETSQLP
jgi:hypothetical protein